MSLFQHFDRLAQVVSGGLDRTDVPVQRLLFREGCDRPVVRAERAGRVGHFEIGVAHDEVGVEIDLFRQSDDLVAGRDRLVPGLGAIVHVDQAVPGFVLVRVRLQQRLQGHPGTFIVLGAQGRVTPVQVALLLGFFQIVGGLCLVPLADGSQRRLQHRGRVDGAAVEIGRFHELPFFIALPAHLVVPADHRSQGIPVPLLVLLVQIVKGNAFPILEHLVEVPLVVMYEPEEVVGVVVARVLHQRGLEQRHGLVPLRGRFADVDFRGTELDFLRVGRDGYQQGEAEGEQHADGNLSEEHYGLLSTGTLTARLRGLSWVCVLIFGSGGSNKESLIKYRYLCPPVKMNRDRRAGNPSGRRRGSGLRIPSACARRTAYWRPLT